MAQHPVDITRGQMHPKNLKTNTLLYLNNKFLDPKHKRWLSPRPQQISRLWQKYVASAVPRFA
ncbi:hypothetical protein [Rubritalea tangerina]|uniref:hypothetical protein n=1 Tax=Rubritalea tangerina TaxID=430798 RepID=UPI0036183A57